MGDVMTCNAGCGRKVGHGGRCRPPRASGPGFNSELLTEAEWHVLRQQKVLVHARDPKAMNLMYLFTELCKARREAATYIVGGFARMRQSVGYSAALAKGTMTPRQVCEAQGLLEKRTHKKAVRA